jgi:hypothetical protein
VVNDLLENLGKRLDSDLMGKIVEMLPGLDLKADQRTYEVFLNMHFTLRNFTEVRSLVAEMRRRKVPFTTRSQMVMIKTALKTGSFDEALTHFRELKELWNETSALASPSAAPTQIVAQVAELACKEHQPHLLLPALQDVPVTTEVLNAMLLEGVRRRDSELEASLSDAVEELALGGGGSKIILQPYSNPSRKRFETTVGTSHCFALGQLLGQLILGVVPTRKVFCKHPLPLPFMGRATDKGRIRIRNRFGFPPSPSFPPPPLLLIPFSSSISLSLPLPCQNKT